VEGNQAAFGGSNNGTWYSWVLATMPFIEQKPLFDNIFVRVNDPATNLPSPWSVANNAWENQNWKFDLGVNICPSSPKPTNRGESPALISYKVCVGDDYHQNHFLPSDGRDNRGVFQMHRWIGMESVTDGTSNTVFLGECVLGGAPNDILGGVAVTMQQWAPQDCWNRVDPNNRKLITNPVRADFRPTGGRALDGRPYFVGFATLIPPNGPSCHWGGVDGNEHMGTLSSFHPNGGQVAMTDGHVHFITQNIDAGNPTVPDDNAINNRPGPSPYGVWGALGSKNGGETAQIP
jgi:prepilin-type processing-associated H-X9-DG protein